MESIPNTTNQRERIARATGRLFRDKGYHGTSMSDISAAVGLSKASLYTHVSAKQDVLRDLVERGARLFMEGIAPIVASTIPAPERIRLALRMHLGVVEAAPDLAAIFLQEWKQLDEDARNDILHMRDLYEEQWRTLVTAAIEEGWFSPELDVRFATLTLLSVANWAYQWFNPHGTLNAESVADQFIALIFGGLLRTSHQPLTPSTGQ